MFRLGKILVVVLVVIVGAGFAGWYFFLKTDPSPRAKIKETPTVTLAKGSEASALDGTWMVSPGNADDFVGYRVTEKLFANITQSTATGRTNNVTGAMSIKGATISAITVTADLRDLSSDSGGRDGAIRIEGLESNKFPEAKFVSTAPIQLNSIPPVGTTISTQATGNFTLHGVTKQVTITLQGRFDGAKLQVVGNLPILFGDYGMTAPSSPVVASVDDHGEMELQLFFTKG